MNLEGQSKGPIFIVGAPRSGTSLLRVMLNRHPAIWLCDETNYFYNVYGRRRAFGDLRATEARQRLVTRFLETERVQGLVSSMETLRDALLREGDSYKSFFTALIRHTAAEENRTRFGEKTPQHALFSELLKEWYPDCSLIHIVRDPRDVVASLLRMPFANDHIAANARTWLQNVLAAERVRDRDGYLLVRYEQLVEEPESEMQRILRHVGEDYDPAVLVADESSRDVDWWFQRAQTPLTRSRVAVWRDELTPDEVGLIEHLTAPGMARFGYPPIGQRPSAVTLASTLAGEGLHFLRNRLTHLRSLWYERVQPTNLAAAERGWKGRAT